MQSDRAYSLQHGCQDPKVLSSRWPLGLDLILKAFKAAREQTVLHLFVEICQVYGPTFEQNLLGARGINTTDPRNLEAILSTQFKGVQAPTKILARNASTMIDCEQTSTSATVHRPFFHYWAMASLRKPARLGNIHETFYDRSL